MKNKIKMNYYSLNFLKMKVIKEIKINKYNTKIQFY